MKKLGNSTYEWVPSPMAGILAFFVWWNTYWEVDLVYPYIRGLSNWLYSISSVLFFLYLMVVKPFIILKCIGLLLYIYVKLTTKYEEPR